MGSSAFAATALYCGERPPHFDAASDTAVPCANPSERISPAVTDEREMSQAQSDTAPELPGGDALLDSQAAAAQAMIAAIDTAVTAPAPYAGSVEEVLQNPELPAGCEAASLAIALRSMGHETTPVDIVENYLPVDYSATSAHAFAGNPYVAYGGAAFPPAIVDAANAYLEAHDDAKRSEDISGSSFSELCEMVERGYPVIVWTTVGMTYPQFTGAYLEGYAWYSQEHCVVMYGMDKESVLVSDPLEGLVKRDIDSFRRIWEACGLMAVAIS